MARTERIYHAVISNRATGAVAGYMPMGGRAKVWADSKQDVARSEFTSIGFGKMTVIDLRQESVMRDAAVRPEPRARTCYRTGEAVEAVLGCPPYPPRSSARVIRGNYAGRAAIEVRSKVECSYEDEDVSETINLYLNPTTFLPMARVTIGTSNRQQFKQVETFATSFVDRGALSKHFFDPNSIG